MAPAQLKSAAWVLPQFLVITTLADALALQRADHKVIHIICQIHSALSDKILKFKDDVI